ncbi:hypothetical protein [Desulfotignum phosphitoxidans]|uniref:Uncharacterized protein n=1 Tax=Desulfotignum phosphitoxidans DSM 13687 TaxID=1286635 RepID=S0G3N6_9BACT|nr:hypothetical protein [Desulfotignum phosphitoxidans]EMS78431.1 hypothetical protein Dpo_8c00980 [Desulfotignum phosphitoxidans DSM 13687]
MKPFTQDKWLNFVIENHNEIQSLIEVWEHAKSNLPDRINSAIIDYITELMGSYFKDKDIQVGGEDKSIWWYEEEQYDKNKDLGIFFQFDGINKDFITSGSFVESAHFYFYIHPHGKKKSEKTTEINRFRKVFQTSKKRLDSEIILLPDDDDRQLLAKYYLKNLNINALKTPEKFKKYIQDAVITFTDEILTILERSH